MTTMPNEPHMLGTSGRVSDKINEDPDEQMARDSIYEAEGEQSSMQNLTQQSAARANLSSQKSMATSNEANVDPA